MAQERHAETDLVVVQAHCLHRVIRRSDFQGNFAAGWGATGGRSMHALVDSRRAPRATALIAVSRGQLRGVLARLGAGASQWVRQSEFRGEAGRFCLVPDARGKLRCVLVGVTRSDDIFALGSLPYALPGGSYRLDTAGVQLDPARVALGWGLGAYRYERYRRSRRAPARLAVDAATLRTVESALAATWQ